MSVRANLHLDERAYEYIYAYAHGKGIPLGAAVSEIVLNRAENAPEEETVLAPPEFRQTEKGYWVRAKRENGLVITPELVKELSEDEFEY
ncbi:hypothetical protein [Terracidiphilus sp.]|jgi:hypothetical protein|uniref:hypothetical protein n=1 Tax=Terracidiphilus sp. TaxID=1964191 RepID=UPI003C15E401